MKRQRMKESERCGMESKESVLSASLNDDKDEIQDEAFQLKIPNDSNNLGQ